MLSGMFKAEYIVIYESTYTSVVFVRTTQ